MARRRSWGDLVPPLRLTALGYVGASLVRFAMHRTWGWALALAVSVAFARPLFRKPWPMLPFVLDETRIAGTLVAMAVVLAVEPSWGAFGMSLFVAAFVMFLIMLFGSDD